VRDIASALSDWGSSRGLVVDISTGGDIAVFSPSRTHRFALTRTIYQPTLMYEPATDTIAPFPRRVLVGCGLNPSTADAWKDDQTIRKGKGFGARWGCGLYIMLNAHGYRATDPADMKRAAKHGDNVVGEYNDALITFVLSQMTEGDIALAAWGAHASPMRDARMREIAAVQGVRWRCFGTNQDGTPKHPLYVPWATQLEDYPRRTP
jgi:hypothetical protein